MKKRKLELYITGKLMSALMVGRPAIFSTGGEMYHTAPVVKIHETETQEIHFETSTTHYYIKPRPFVLAALNPRRQTLAFSFYCQNHISSELVLAYIIFGYAIVLFYHFCTPIIFSSMGILVVNDSDKESCRIEN